MAADFQHINSSKIADQARPFSLIEEIANNVKNMRFNLMEFSGGLGDLGTFIPLVAAVSIVTGMDIAIILIFAGLANITTGLIFGLPVPVQPMKAIAAVAIAEQLLPAEIAAAGLIAGAVVFTLGVSGIIEKIECLIPKAIIRGIQLGVGLKLVYKGMTFINSAPLWGLNSIIVAISLGLLVIFLRKIKNFPSALFLFLAGLTILFVLSPSSLVEIEFSLPSFSFVVPSVENWLNGFTRGALPQIPLTILNSVFAVCILSGDLFPGRKISSRRMATSVGLMNLLGCWLGGLPMCHGSGGLAGQYHFGARTGGAVALLGSWKLFFGLFLGVATMNIIQQYPLSILGIMLIYAGIELGMPARDQKTAKGICVVIATVVGIFVVNTGIGFLLGLITYLLIGLIKARKV